MCRGVRAAGDTWVSNVRGRSFVLVSSPGVVLGGSGGGGEGQSCLKCLGVLQRREGGMDSVSKRVHATGSQ